MGDEQKRKAGDGPPVSRVYIVIKSLDGTSKANRIR